jgi:hypothetical protein
LESRELYDSAGSLQPLNASGLLAELERTYTMNDEQSAHHKDSAAAPNPSNEITFF